MKTDYLDEKTKTQKLSELLYDFLQNNKFNLDLQVKPKTEYELLKQFNKAKSITSETLRKQNSLKLEKQINLIANNIVIKFFELSDEKFLAVMNRMNVWRI